MKRDHFCKSRVKKFPDFYGTKMCVTVFTSACHFTLSWSPWTQSTPTHQIYKINFNIVLSLIPKSSKWYSPQKLFIHFSSTTSMLLALSISFSFTILITFGKQYKFGGFSARSFPHYPLILLLTTKYLPQHLFLQILSYILFLI